MLPLVVIGICIASMVILGHGLVSVSPQAQLAASMPAPSAGGNFVAFVSSWVGNLSGPAGVLVLVITQVVFIIACVPCCCSFDYTAGAVFGIIPGMTIAMVGKGCAAMLTFALVRSLSKDKVECWVQGRARQGGERNRWATMAARLHEGVKNGGFGFCIILRLSPLPSWVANYVLPLAGVPFPTYLLASMIGMVLPLLANVYQGAAAASIAASISGRGGRGRRDSIGLIALAACQWLMGVVLAQRMAKYASSASREEALEFA